MKLYVLILVIAVLVSSEANVPHVDFSFIGCSDTEKEGVHGSDGEEIIHIDFNKKKEVETPPDFADAISFPEFSEWILGEIDTCKFNLNVFSKGLKYPPDTVDKPESSIYAENDVELTVENVLICHVTGLFPPPVTVSWFKNNVNVTEGMSLSQYRRNNDGTFNIYSSLKFTPEEGDMYSCTVNHKALDQPQTKTWDVNIALPSVGPAVFCGVGLALGLLGVAAGTFFLIKGNNSH